MTAFSASRQLRRPNSGHRARSGRRPLGCRRPGPLAEAKRSSDVYLLSNLDCIIKLDPELWRGVAALSLEHPRAVQTDTCILQLIPFRPSSDHLAGAYRRPQAVTDPLRSVEVGRTADPEQRVDAGGQRR